MNTPEQFKMDIPKEIIEKKKNYGTYAVMALNNVRTVLDFIQKAVDIEGEMSEESDDNCFHPVMNHLRTAAYETDMFPEKTLAIMEKLTVRFQFLEIMAENQREHESKKPGNQRTEINARDIFTVLDRMFKALRMYRNATTHLQIIDPKWDEYLAKTDHPLSINMDKYLTVALRKLAEKYSYTQTDLAFIQSKRVRNRTVDGKKRKETNYDFFLSMVRKDESPNAKQYLSWAGVAMLICLFLDKQYINIFLDKMPRLFGKYTKQDNEYRIIKRFFAVRNIVLPKERLVSEKNKMSVAMDMLNELRRCPRELFDTLSTDNQNRFRSVSDDHEDVLLWRSSDRFPQLILQYIDYNNLFDSIRFHVNMGKLRYLFKADKYCIDKQTRPRVLEHPLNGFGRIQEVEKHRKHEDGTFGDSGIPIRDFEHVRRDDADEANYPYIVDTYTRYMLENDKVEMMFCNGTVMPKINRNGDGKWSVNKQVPACRMSTLELPAMMFHILLCGPDKTEERIREVYDNYRGLFRTMSDGLLTEESIKNFDIKPADLPRKVLDAVAGVTEGKDYKRFVEAEVTRMWKETKRLMEILQADLEAVNSSDNKMGKRGFRQIRPGNMAAFLAKDIVTLQESREKGERYGTDRMTGMNYRVMQSAMAIFNTYAQPDAAGELWEMFDTAGLTKNGRQGTHPFLHKVMAGNPCNTTELYKMYLEQREHYLNDLRGRCMKGKSVMPVFINDKQTKWQKRDADFYKKLGDRYRDSLPVELPRQMFDEDIKNKLRNMPQMEGVDFDNVNVTYLIGEYMRRVCMDDCQEFYSWSRNYRYIDLLKGRIDAKGSLCNVFTTTEEREVIWKEREAKAEEYYDRCRKRRKQERTTAESMSDEDYDDMLKRSLANNRIKYQKNEKTIRRYKVQDALLFLTARDVIRGEIQVEGKKFKLKEIMPDTDRGILSEKQPMDFKLKKNNKEYIIHAKEMKFKNYGDFYKLANDKRLSTLLELFETETRIDKDELEKELERYDVCRPEMTERILKFEEWAYKACPELINMVTAENKFGFGNLVKELRSRNLLTEHEEYILRRIRNAFSHNAYPPSDVVNDREMPKIADRLTDRFYEYTAQKEGL